ncbi:hypothetical protein [Cryobacterium psychrophilum]|uniref:Uncharacterized protein n=2 Tax=Cryobacterium psychrophilum TaxID=41988 RepID=A0A4Y8KTP4_9MICO|nr:hypothetical protein [Cryobacterium psychrophilum]TFD78680.1 hypothetical protein E3T53_10500 [Cryobacterium psychrophilum]
MGFDNRADVLQILIVGSAAYLTLLVVLRLSGKRTLGADGVLRREALKTNRPTESEIRHAARGSGSDLSAIAAVALETNGTLSVIASSTMHDGSALNDVQGGAQL